MKSAEIIMPQQHGNPQTLDAEELTGLRCPACDYDLTGSTQAKCPECGASFIPIELRISSLKWREDQAFIDRSVRWTFMAAAILLAIQISIQGIIALKPADYEIPQSLEFTIGFLLLPLVIAGHPLLLLFAVAEFFWARRPRVQRAMMWSLIAFLVSVSGIIHFSITFLAIR